MAREARQAACRRVAVRQWNPGSHVSARGPGRRDAPQRSPGSCARQWNPASHVIARGCGRRDRCRVLVCGSASMESRVARNRTWSRDVRRPQVCRPRVLAAAVRAGHPGPVKARWALGPLRSILQFHSGRASRLQASPQPRASCHGCVLRGDGQDLRLILGSGDWAPRDLRLIEGSGDWVPRVVCSVDFRHSV